MLILREVTLVLEQMPLLVVDEYWMKTTTAIEIMIDDPGAIVPIMIDGANMTSPINDDEDGDIIMVIIILTMMLPKREVVLVMDDVWRVARIDARMEDLRGIARRIVAWDMHHPEFQGHLRKRLDRHDEDRLLDTERKVQVPALTNLV